MVRRALRLVEISLVVLCASLVLSPSGEATVRRVPQDYPTIQQAVTAAVSGDTILVSAGTYREAVTLKGGVRLHAALGAADVVIDASGFTAADSATDYVVGWPETSNRIDVVGFILIDDNLSNGAGVLVRGSNHLVEGNTVRGQFRYGIRVEGNPSGADAMSNLIVGNRVFGTRRTTQPSWTHAGISLQKSSLNRLTNNYAYAGTYGIEVVGGGLNRLAGNTGVASTGVLAPVSGIRIETSGKITLENNTAYANGTEATYGLSVHASTGVTINNSTMSSQSYGLRSTGASTINVSHSLVWGGIAHISGDGVTLGEQALVGLNPLLAAPTDGDYRLLPSSPGINAGTGQDRDGSPADMGAYGGIH